MKSVLLLNIASHIRTQKQEKTLFSVRMMSINAQQIIQMLKLFPAILIQMLLMMLEMVAQQEMVEQVVKNVIPMMIAQVIKFVGK